jgi:hypothetical protein
MSEHASALLPNLVAGLLLAGKRDAKEIGGLAVTFDVTKEADIRCLIKAGANLKVLEQPVDTRPAPVVPSSACWRCSPPSRQTPPRAAGRGHRLGQTGRRDETHRSGPGSGIPRSGLRPKHHRQQARHLAPAGLSDPSGGAQRSTPDLGAPDPRMKSSDAMRRTPPRSRCLRPTRSMPCGTWPRTGRQSLPRGDDRRPNIE